MACAGPVRVGIGVVWPMNTPCRWLVCYWKRTGCTIWLWRIGVGVRWMMPWPELRQRGQNRCQICGGQRTIDNGTACADCVCDLPNAQSQRTRPETNENE